MSIPSAKQSLDTSRMWELARFVEAHPDDHEQRWRLVKKLYAAWEYRLALEHLLVLKKEWRRKLNVVRYLAATYYRLGRYDEAIEELREALEYWANDDGLHEQLGRVYETAGRRDEAVAVWQELQQLKPGHPMAEAALRRLQREESRSEEEAPPDIAHSDNGIDLSPGQVCAHCGAQNSDGFDRCWQCHAPLYGHASSARSTSGSRRGRVLGMSPDTARLTASLLLVGLLTLCLYLSVRLLWDWYAISEDPVLRSFDELYQHLGLTRVATGVALILFWPLALSTALRIIKPRKPVSGPLLTIGAMIVGATAYLAQWFPGAAIAAGAAIPALLSIGLILAVLRLPIGRGFAVWALHLVIITVLGAGVAVLAEYAQTRTLFNPLRDVPTLLRHSQAATGVGALPLPGNQMPFEVRNMQWASTGSPWLDKRAGEAVFTVVTPETGPDIKFEIQDHTGTTVYEPIPASPYRRPFPVTMDQPHHVMVWGPEGTPVQVTVTSFLKPVLPRMPLLPRIPLEPGSAPAAE